VEDEADVADGESGDVRDLLIRAIVLKFEFEDLLLIGGEGFDEVPDAVGEVLDVGVVTGFLLGCGEQGEGCFIAELEALFLAEDIEGAVATDGVEPSFEVFPDLGVIGDPEFEEGVLDDITSPFGVPIEDAGGVADERAFMFL